jgi:molecular chaperone GrpE
LARDFFIRDILSQLYQWQGNCHATSANKPTMTKEKVTEPESTEGQVQEEIVDQNEEATDAPETKAEENNDAQWKDKYVRLHAEFDNFRKRNTRERVELIKNANGDLMSNLVTVLDDFDRAIMHNADNTDVEALREGFGLIHQKLFKFLEGRGLEPLNALGETFDTDYHEALTQIPAADDSQKGKVVDVIEKGYLLNGKILRYAKVVIGN